jgi:hypothetical protein
VSARATRLAIAGVAVALERLTGSLAVRSGVVSIERLKLQSQRGQQHDGRAAPHQAPRRHQRLDAARADQRGERRHHQRARRFDFPDDERANRRCEKCRQHEQIRNGPAMRENVIRSGRQEHHNRQQEYADLACRIQQALVAAEEQERRIEENCSTHRAVRSAPSRDFRRPARRCLAARRHVIRPQLIGQRLRVHEQPERKRQHRERHAGAGHDVRPKRSDVQDKEQQAPVSARKTGVCVIAPL